MKPLRPLLRGLDKLGKSLGKIADKYNNEQLYFIELIRKYDVYDTREDGQVLVNYNHPPYEVDVLLAPQIARVIKLHQVKLHAPFITNLLSTC